MTRILTAILISSLPALAGAATFDGATTVSAKSEREVFPVADGHMAIVLTSRTEPLDMGEGNPFTGMSGTCHGTMIVRMPSASGGGVCAYRNEAGDTAVLRFEVDSITPDGGLSGSWSVLGGTGAAAGVQGGGAYVNSPAAADGSYTQTISGAVSMP